MSLQQETATNNPEKTAIEPTMQEIQEEVVALSKCKIIPDQDAQHFTKRVSEKLQKFSDEVWESLSPAAQEWHNDLVTAMEENKKREKTGQEPLPLRLLTVPEAVEKAKKSEKEVTAPLDSSAENDYNNGVEVVNTGPHGGEGEPEDDMTARRNKSNRKTAVARKAVVKKAAARNPARGGGKTRWADDAKITVLAKENPHRAGTKNHKTFSKYESGMTVAEAIKAGIVRSNMYYEAGLSNIKVG